jgi:lantibiotic modifying enzyme
VIERCFDASALDEALLRLRQFGEDDLAFQTAAIRDAFRSIAVRNLVAPVAAEHSAVAAAHPEPGVALRERAIAHAARVARAIEARAIRGSGGEASWVGVRYLPAARRYEIGPATLATLDGYCGTALFLAALERVAGGGGYGRLALAALAPLRNRLGELERAVRLRRFADVGGATGLGAAAYALARIADLLGEPDVLADSRRVGALITPDAVAASDPMDVVSGSAGAILSLVALHDAARDGLALERASLLASGLLARRARDEASGLRFWPTWRGHPEPGFAHGHAGIAYALLRIARETADASLVEAAREALVAERRLLGGGVRGAEPRELTAAWSHGASGIGLARLGALDVLDTPEVRADVDDALCVARRHLLDGVDTLCCGAAARIELMLTAAAVLGRPELRDEATAAAAGVVARADARGAFLTGWGDDDGAPAALFHGAPGVAYELLRVCAPDVLPSLLLWA